EAAGAGSRGGRRGNAGLPAAPGQTVHPAALVPPRPSLPPPPDTHSTSAHPWHDPRLGKVINLPDPGQTPIPDPLPEPTAATAPDQPVPALKLRPRDDPPRAARASHLRPGCRPNNAVAVPSCDQRDGTGGQPPSRRLPA